MKLIIGDIGNTFCKICLINEKKSKIIKIFNLETKNIKTVKDIKVFFKNKKLLTHSFFSKKALFASVVPSVYLLFKKFLKKEFDIMSFDIKDKKIKQIVKVNVKNSYLVGSDRIVSILATFEANEVTAILLSFDCIILCRLSRTSCSEPALPG